MQSAKLVIAGIREAFKAPQEQREQLAKLVSNVVDDLEREVRRRHAPQGAWFRIPISHSDVQKFADLGIRDPASSTKVQKEVRARLQERGFTIWQTLPTEGDATLRLFVRGKGTLLQNAHLALVDCLVPRETPWWK